jgi:hypothetical protein
MMKLKYLLFLALAFSTVSQAYIIELAISYDDAAYNAAVTWSGTTPENRINTFVSAANGWYKRQNIPIQLQVNVITKTFQGRFPYPPTPGVTGAALSQMALLRESMKMRTAYDADFRLHFTSGSTESCGIGYLRTGLTFTETYSTNNIVDINCQPETMAHELGHNFGLLHSQRQDPTSQGVYSYGKGYGVDNSFVTIMAYPSAFNYAQRITYFSDPTLSLPNLGPIGATTANSKVALTNIAQRLSTIGEVCRSDFLFQINSICTPHKVKAWLKWKEGTVSKSALALESTGAYGTVYTVSDASPVNVLRTGVSLTLFHATIGSDGKWYPVESLRSCELPVPITGRAYRFVADFSSSYCKATIL